MSSISEGGRRERMSLEEGGGGGGGGRGRSLEEGGGGAWRGRRGSGIRINVTSLVSTCYINYEHAYFM